MNFKRVLSKSSVRSSSSSRKSLSQTADEVSKLQSEIELLKQTVDSLKVSVESRDAAIGTLAREKENLYVELKSVQRTNRSLHQQIMDERDMHSKEKDYFIGEIKRLNHRRENVSREDFGLEEVSQMNWLKEEIHAKNEIIYNVCKKYLKIKSSKIVIQKNLEKLQSQSKKICEDIILLLQDNRNILDELLEQLIRTCAQSPTSDKYFQLLRINVKLHFENAQLKIHLSSHQNIVNDNKEHRRQPSDEHDGACASKWSDSEIKLQRENIRVRSAHCTLRNKRDNRNFEHIEDVISGFLNFPNKVYRLSSDPCIYRSVL